MSFHAAATAPSKVARAQETHEYPSSAPARQRAAHSSATAIRAVDVFATAYINWNPQTVAGDMRLLAAASIGQARSAMQLAAAETSRDYELERGGVANTGVVVAIAPLRNTPDRYVVVTRESTTATDTNAYAGLRPAWHVTIATVTSLGAARWVVSGWQPQS